MGLLRVIKKEDHNSAKIVQILNLNKQIKFVSLMGVDLGGNATDEKIPVEITGLAWQYFSSSPSRPIE